MGTLRERGKVKYHHLWQVLETQGLIGFSFLVKGKKIFIALLTNRNHTSKIVLHVRKMSETRFPLPIVISNYVPFPLPDKKVSA